MSQSPYSFTVFIDESGDEGFKIVPFPERQSSEWFLISAMMFPSHEWAKESRTIKQALGPLETNERKIHFANLRHEQRTLVIDAIAQSSGTASSVCIHKAGFDKEHSLDKERRLYFYTTRMLLERVSWFARTYRRAGVGNGKAKLVFAHCKSLSYDSLKTYLGILHDSSSSRK